MFWGRSASIPLALFKILLSAAFLIRLMGPRSVISGFAVCAILVPLSSRLSNNYTSVRSKLTNRRDETMNCVAEAIQALPQIRFLSLEESWIAQIIGSRTVELREAWKMATSMAFVNSLVELSPVLLSAVSISIYALEHGTIRPSIVFTSLGLFSDIHSSLRTLPQMVAAIHDSWVSYKRIEHYLAESEVEQFLAPSEGIVFQAAAFNWPTTSASKMEISGLHNITISFLHSKLNVVVGKTGSGKSLLLATMLGESNLDSGEVGMPKKMERDAQKEKSLDWIVPGSTALVSQPPWIDNASVRENILFGLPFDSSRYHGVIIACALEQDLSQMKQGDATKVGAKGAMLSGGQRWRIALARAMYSRASILLLDDVLSAVDGAVAHWIVKNALTGVLAHGRTIILVTHNLDVCAKHASFLVELEDQTVRRAVKLDPDFVEEVKTDKLISQHNKTVEDITSRETICETVATESSKLQQTRSSPPPSINSISFYIHAAGGWISVFLALAATAAHQLLSAGTSRWLMRWTDDAQGDHSLLRYRLGVYLLLSLSVGLSKTIQDLVYAGLGLNASRRLFQSMLIPVLKAPLSWITDVPAGQLITSFGTDFYSIDSQISQAINGLVGDCFRLVIVMGTRYAFFDNKTLRI
jgi:ABC-type multidrug transport system fused ATPase/permease subunit